MADLAATETAGDTEQLKARIEFLAGREPFTELSPQQLERVARSIVEVHVPAGRTVLVESGTPGDSLYVIREGAFDLAYKQAVVAVLASGEVFGHPTLLTGLSPEFTTTARQDSVLYCIPREIALGVLCRPEGVRFVAQSLRERLLEAARTMRALPDAVTRPVTSLVRSKPVFCDPGMSIREASRLMGQERRSALLVRTNEGLGIVTDLDVRDKVVAGDLSHDVPVSRVMTMPAKTVPASMLATEAAIEMMAAGVNHLPVIDADGSVVGILSASSLMTLEARSPFAVRRTILDARSLDEVTKAAADLPQLFVDLMASHLDAPSVTRVLTLLHDAMTERVLELAIDKLGEPPVSFAWLAFGSAARSELNLVSDQDNGLAYSDTDDPDVDRYFQRLAQGVNEGLRRCGFALDVHGTVASNWQWRMPLSKWRFVFARSLEGRDTNRLARASVSFDFRQVAGDLMVAPVLTTVMRDAPMHRLFMKGIQDLATRNPSPLTFLQRLPAYLDIKTEALLPIQNLVRYHSLARGITAHTTLERLAAIREAGGIAPESETLLREAFTTLLHLQLRHHANRIRSGRPPDNMIETATLRPLTRVTLQEAIREAEAAHKRFARPVTPPAAV